MNRLAQGFHRFNWALTFLANYQAESLGGQAVIEGVLMRSPRRLAVAVRSPGGEIVVDNREFLSYSRRFRILGLPILRGAASLLESLAIGVKALNFSMAVQERGPHKEVRADEGRLRPEPGQQGDILTEMPDAVPAAAASKHRLIDNLLVGFSLLCSLGLAMGLFQLLPYWVAGTVIGGTKDAPQDPLLFNFTAGLVRMSLLLAYMWGISFLKDISRVFQYHGAEHKSIFAHERKGPLTVAGAKSQSRFHPRCGTSFILIVALVCILFFSMLDTLIWQGFHYAYPTFFHRFLIHLPFVPLVAGLSFEVLKLTARFQTSPWVRPFILPGLWLQQITTREPDDSQLEVAIASIEAVA
jgi:uncharacterized protein YqhQ